MRRDFYLGIKILAWLVFCLWASVPVSFAEEDAPAPQVSAENENSYKVLSVKLSPPDATIVYQIDVRDPSRPIVIHVGEVNAIDNVMNDVYKNMWIAPSPKLKFTCSKGSPHKIEMSFSEATSPVFPQVLILNDKSITARPSYHVETTVKEEGVKGKENTTTDVRCELLITNGSPSDLTGAKLEFEGYGMEIKPPMNVACDQLRPCDECTVHATLVQAKPHHTPLKFPLGLWAKDSDFKTNDPESKKGVASAILTLPAKGNWPSQLTLPGSIYVSIPGNEVNEIAVFSHNQNDPNSLKHYQDIVTKDFWQFPNMPASFKIDLHNESFNSISSNDKWPTISYDEVVVYRTPKPSPGNFGVFVQVKGQTREITTSDYYDTVSHESTLTIFPGLDPILTLESLKKTLAPNNLTARSIEKDGDDCKRKRLLDQVSPIYEKLPSFLAVLDVEKKLLDSITRRIDDSQLTKPAPKTDPKLRAQQAHAKQALSSLIDSYNEWILSQP